MMTHSTNNKEVVHAHYMHTHTTRIISDKLITYLPHAFSEVIALCIGTDRSTGDSLGPLTGTVFSQMNPQRILVYGTLHAPVHAINLHETIAAIYKVYRNPFIIAIDASLGKSKSVGDIMTNNESIRPGSALNKNLVPVGDAYLTGVVNIGGVMDFAILQSTRLSMVHDMATQLAEILFKTDRWIFYYEQNKQIVT